MTPRELLDDALLRFQVMYLSKPVQESILRQALTVCQCLTGPVASVAIDGAPTAKPPLFVGVSNCMDSEGRWHDVYVSGAEISVVTTRRSSPPFLLEYFISLRDLDIDSGNLPNEVISLLSEYLCVCLAIPNTQRARSAMTVTGINLELTDDAELHSRKLAIEELMSESCISKMVTVY